MKTLFLFLLITGLSQAQITEIDLGESKQIGRVANSIECTRTQTPDFVFYIFRYKDSRYSSLNIHDSFTVGSDEDFQALYDKIIENFDKESKDNYVLDLNNGSILMINFDKIQKNSIRIGHVKNGVIMGLSGSLNKKKINILFGKKN